MKALLPRRCFRVPLLAALVTAGASNASTQDYSVESIGFLTATGASAGFGFTVSGSLTAVGSAESTAGVFGISGSLRTVVAADLSPLPSPTRLVNAGFEEPPRDLVADEEGWMEIPPQGSSTNLLPWGDAEGLSASDGSVGSPIPGWDVEGNLAVIAWDAPGADWISSAAPGPVDRGLNLFYGGVENPSTRATTRVVLPVGPVSIDRGEVEAEVSGWFGGFLGQGDTSMLTVTFLDAETNDLGTIRIGGITPLQRANWTGLVRDGATWIVPVGAREADVVLEMRREAGTGWNDGMADNLSLVLRHDAPGPLPGWSVLGSGIRWIDRQNPRGWQPPHGDRFVDLATDPAQSSSGGIAQTLVTVPNQRYRLRFALGTYRDSLVDAGPVVVDVGVGGTSRTFQFQPDRTGNAWASFDLPFTATSTATRLSWTGRSTGGGAYLGVDAIEWVEETEPEAPTLDLAAAVGGGGGGALAFSFESTAGQRYALQSVNALSSGAWTVVPGSELIGTGKRLTLTVPAATEVAVRFFRLRVGP